MRRPDTGAVRIPALCLRFSMSEREGRCDGVINRTGGGDIPRDDPLVRPGGGAGLRASTMAPWRRGPGAHFGSVEVSATVASSS